MCAAGCVCVCVCMYVSTVTGPTGCGWDNLCIIHLDGKRRQVKMNRKQKRSSREAMPRIKRKGGKKKRREKEKRKSLELFSTEALFILQQTRKHTC